MGDLRIVVDESEIEGLSADVSMRQLLHAVGDQLVVPGAQQRAPHRTGAGAASIHGESFLDGPEWTEHISWDRDHFYMYFQHEGTKVLPPHPFLIETLEGLAQ